MERDGRHHGGNISPGDTNGGNLIGANVRFESMSLILPEDEMSAPVARNDPPQNDAEESYDPSSHHMKRSPDTKKSDSEGKIALSRVRRKE